MKRISLIGRIFCTSVALAFVSCEVVDNIAKPSDGETDTTYVDLEKVASILADIPLAKTHLDEVHDAVSSSSGNGYDEEYTMRHLFGNPGSGVGDKAVRSGTDYTDPLWKLIDRKVRSMAATKSSGIDDPDSFLKMLTESDIQIYWPYSDKWNGKDMPVITFDPEDGARTNIGYKIKVEDDGFRHVEEVVVDEETAMEVPVWVVNRNTDSGYTSLEMLRREDPAWGEGGGTIIINPSKSSPSQVKSGSTMKTLVLKDFTMKRNYDSWFAGASEFFVKIGYLDNFTASTEAEMRLYNPMVTDFMIVVKRSQAGIPQPFNAILITEWSDQMESCAFMITEDDGGTRTEWTSKAKVFVAGKSYGVEITIPLNVRDDVVWRGQLASRWFDESKGESWPFGDVELTFDIL